MSNRGIRPKSHGTKMQSRVEREGSPLLLGASAASGFQGVAHPKKRAGCERFQDRMAPVPEGHCAKKEIPLSQGDKGPEGLASTAKQTNIEAAKAYKLEVLGLFQAEAAEIAAARTKSQYIHHGGNIRSAGDEVETAVRSFYGRRLPRSYTVHHGHFLDASLSLSSQMDIVIADHGRFPVFFRGQEGMEYIPYEGVYAYGEVKSAITNEHVRRFITTVKDIRARLKRESVPNGYIERFEEDERGNLLWQPWPERGDVYRFIFAVSSESLDVDRCLKDLCDAELENTPNLICLMDRGVIMAGRSSSPNGEVTETYIHPQKMRATRATQEVDGWVFSQPNNDHKEGATLFYSYTHLMEHLKNNVLLQTNYLSYVKDIVRLTTHFVHRRDK
jgi:hypothetical protein